MCTQASLFKYDRKHPYMTSINLLNKMKGISFDIEGLYFTCFRKTTSTSILLSYPIPPFTTIRGFIANCLGLRRDDFYLQNKLKIGIRAISNKEKNRELCRILKLVSREKEKCFKRVFPSAPMFREFLINPKYRIYIIAGDELLKKIFKRLQDPERPLYLGQSEDMVSIENIEILPIKPAKSNQIHSVVEGIHKNCEIARIPYKFSLDAKSLEELTISIPMEYPVILDKEIEGFRFGAELVWCC
ncbi:MAG TPA: CRISPR-associated protein Cas5 [Methanosarcinales archaeon]|nr:CRISPR-associated protein Cas5 [Methanosarcinales archaeon]